MTDLGLKDNDVSGHFNSIGGHLPSYAINPKDKILAHYEHSFTMLIIIK